MFLYLYVFYVCATFHGIWRSGFEVTCTLVSALKSNMAAISMETNRGIFFSMFSILIIINIQWNDSVEKWVGPNTIFRPAPPPPLIQRQIDFDKLF